MTISERMRRLPRDFRTVGTYTPILGNDGSDLASAVQTILQIGDAGGLAEAVEDAFPGSHLSVGNNMGRFALSMHQHGLLRPLDASELSDGTLRYLLWIAALLTPRPPALVVLNEPETSLHPNLLPALARLVARVSQHSQVIVVTHASPLIAALGQADGCNSIMLEKAFGETIVVGTKELSLPAWHWPSR